MIDSISVVGYVAAGLVGATFYMKSMVSLRSFAIASNICFIIYAYYHSPQLYPVLMLHMFLLPLNVQRLWHLKRKRPINVDRYRNHIGSAYYLNNRTSLNL